MTRLLMADDHGLMREGLKRLFDVIDDIEVAGEAVNGKQVLEAVRRDSFDIVLLDLNMPGADGIELIKQIKAAKPALPILVLSMHNEPPVVRRALNAGAAGYISKDTNEPTRLMNAIRAVAAGGRYIDPAMAQELAFEEHAKAAPHDQLSDREFEVFQLLARGMSVGEAANLLCISNKTVSTHKCRLMEKMGMKTTAELVRYALDHGLLE